MPIRDSRAFDSFAKKTSRAAGRPAAFLLAVSLIVLWAISGPWYRFSITWALLINTVTTIVTFLMVFVIQNTQSRESASLQLKIDELIRVTEARNSLIAIERLSVTELEALEKRFAEFAARAGEHPLEVPLERPLDENPGDDEP